MPPGETAGRVPGPPDARAAGQRAHGHDVRPGAAMMPAIVRSLHVAVVCIFVVTSARSVFAQASESIGTRAAGMGGAFVAVASDSRATWWNPAGIAAGPLLDA